MSEPVVEIRQLPIGSNTYNMLFENQLRHANQILLYVPDVVAYSGWRVDLVKQAVYHDPTAETMTIDPAELQVIRADILQGNLEELVGIDQTEHKRLNSMIQALTDQHAFYQHFQARFHKLYEQLGENTINPGAKFFNS